MSDTTQQERENWPAPPVGSPCWIEIMSSNPAKLKEFYAALFPAWNFKASEENGNDHVAQYTFEQPKGLSGGIVKLPEGHKPAGVQPMGIGYTVYYFVPSIDEIEKKISGIGGVKVLAKTEQGKDGWYANFKDPEGNRFGVYEHNWAKSE